MTKKANACHGPAMFVGTNGFWIFITLGELQIGTMKDSQRHGLTIVIDGQQIKAEINR